MDLNRRDTLATDLNVLADFNPVLPEKYKEARILILEQHRPTLQTKSNYTNASSSKADSHGYHEFWMDII